MTQPAYIDTPFLVLRLSHYSESSVIVGGITPDHGSVSFAMRGAKRLGAKRFPVVDLFRLLQIQYRDRDRDLQQLQRADLTADYGAVARTFEAYRCAGWLARFALANIPERLEHPQVFHALCVGLSRLSRAHELEGSVTALTDAVIVGVCVTYLQESGLLDQDAEDSRTWNQCSALLAMAAGTAPAPRLTADSWAGLRTWAVERLHEAECHVPDPKPKTSS